MSRRGSKLYSIFGGKCPKCNQGDLYKSSIFGGIYNMHEKCPKCGEDFCPEPGFYWGAMYVGYALNSVYLLGGTGIGIWVLGLTPMKAFSLVLVLGIIMIPITARIARNMWLNTNVHYNKKVADAVAARAEAEKKDTP